MYSFSGQLMVRISFLSAFSRPAGPLTGSVSGGVAAGAGRFPLAENIPCNFLVVNEVNSET